ncbi:tannase and feruloyl esterase [Apiospora aurea]|uniref:Carboxylic ester hydrolase n=1 Tax=Apiospora aurea TaxID=335848 RepID=A0ABR1Q8Q4_9PEZI
MRLESGFLGLALPSLAATRSIQTAASFEEKCLQFRPEASVKNSTRTGLQFVKAGARVTLSDNDPSCGTDSQVVTADVCRIAMSIPTSNRSSITYEMWLPEDWSGRFLATGNGGIGGCVEYKNLAYGTANGLATVGTNNGHNGTRGDTFYQNDDVVADFGWRSLHTSVVVGKKLTALFYGAAASKSYFIGCSLGGRQGIHSAEVFPDDFDGIVAGAPAVDFNNLYSSRARYFTVTGADGAQSFIAADTWKTTIHDEVLRQCDGIDGAMDGIIEDPTLCKFQPETLLCGAKTDGGDCLTDAQVGTVNKVFSNYLWSNGSMLYPAMQPGSEIAASGGLYNGKAYAPSVGWFKFAVLEDPAWDPVTFTTDDALVAGQKDPGGIRTWPSSLAAFEGRGGKILTYHGQQDQQITSFNSIRFYEHLASGMGYAPEQMDRFYRFFRIPGMGHCSSGPGAWVVGQAGSSAVRGIPFDREHNVLAAVVDWVEKGVAPEALVGTKFVNDTVSAGIAYQHTHCKYPAKSTFKGGEHNPSEVGSWECV